MHEQAYYVLCITHSLVFIGNYSLLNDFTGLARAALID